MAQEEEKNGLEFVTTKDLLDELVERHDEIIVIRTNIKDNCSVDIRYKTDDLHSAIIMLGCTQAQLVKDEVLGT